tara:strand:- start:940 stop:4011 length:3072 start_codon:yes stop_codon:yes gene_type:complete
MATTFTDLTGDGNNNKAFSFPSYQESDIKVEVDDVLKSASTHYNITGYTTSGGGTIVFTGGNIPTAGQVIRIYRDTDVDTAKSTYVSGSSFKASDLNDNSTQILYAAQEEQNQPIVTSKIKDSAVTTAKIRADNITSALIADDQINSEHYVDGSIDTAHIADGQVTRVKIAADAIDSTKLADAAVDSEHFVAGSIDTVHIADSQITSAKIADGTIVNADIASNAAIDASKVNLGTITASTATALATGRTISLTGDVTYTSPSFDGSGNVTAAAAIGSGVVVNADVNASAAIAHSKLAAVPDGQIIVGSGSTVPTAVAVSGDITLANDGAVTIANDAVEIGMIGCEQTTISDSDSHIPTSGAVVDYVAAQLQPFGGFEVIANRTSFPNTVPASGVVISILDANGVVFDSTSTPDTTTGNCTEVDGTNVTIQAAPDTLQGKTIGAGVGLLCSYSGSGTNYTFHRLLAKDDDVEQLSQDINDFKARYRVASSAPGSDNDAGDLYFDTNADKMYVRNAANNAWGEVTSTGDYKYLTIKDHDQAVGGSGPTFNGSNEEFDLFDGSSDASINTAAQLLVVLNGVLQKPNTGTFSGSEEGFYLNDTHGIKFCDPPPSGSVCFVTQIGTGTTLNVPADNSVTSAKIADGAIVNADVNTSAAIAGSKLADDSIAEAKLDIHAAPSGTDKFLGYTSNGMEWAVPSNTNTTYSVSCVDGDNSDEEKIRLTDSGAGTDDVVLEAGTGLSIARSGDKITFTNTVSNTNTQLSTEEVQDIAGPLVATGGTKTGITVTYDDANGDMDFVVDDATKLPLAGGTITGDVVFDNATNSGHDVTWDMSDSALEFADNVKATFGADGDLAIVHTGSNSDITDSGGGDLRLIASTLKILNAAASETIAIFTQNAGAELYYDNTKEFETKLGGVKLYGHSECAVNALGNVNSNPTFDFTVANYITMTLTGNVTVQNPTTESVGQSGSIIITQDGTGSRTCAWSNQFKWTGGTAPTLTTTASAVDRIDYLVVAADTIHCVASLDVK